MKEKSMYSLKVEVLALSVLAIATHCGCGRPKSVDSASNAEEPQSTLAFKRTTRLGKIVEISGAARHPVGTNCELELEPTPTEAEPGSYRARGVGAGNEERLACRATITCGDTRDIVYGGSTKKGWFYCTFKAGLPVTGRDSSDSDGDPKFKMDLPGMRIVLAVEQAQAPYSTTIELQDIDAPAALTATPSRCWIEDRVSRSATKRLSPFVGRTATADELRVKWWPDVRGKCDDKTTVLVRKTIHNAPDALVFTDEPHFGEEGSPHHDRCYKPWRKAYDAIFDGVKPGDILTEVDHKKVQRLTEDIFDVDVPDGTPSVSITVERPRTDGFVGTKTHEARIRLPQLPTWRMVRHATGPTTDSSSDSPLILGVADLGARGKLEMMFLQYDSVFALDLDTGCTRQLATMPAVSGARTHSAAVFTRIAPNQVVLQVKRGNQMPYPDYVLARFHPDQISAPFSAWQLVPSLEEDEAALNLDIMRDDDLCELRRECLFDVDGDGKLDFLHPLGAARRGNRLAFDSVRGLVIRSSASGGTLFRKRIDAQTIKAAPGYNTLASVDFATSQAPRTSWCVRVDVVGAPEPEWVKVGREGLDIYQDFDEEPLSTVGWERIENFSSWVPPANWNARSIAAIDIDHDGTPEIVGLGRTEERRDIGPGKTEWHQTIRPFVIKTAQKGTIAWPLCQGTPDARIDEPSRLRYSADPGGYMANMGKP